MHELLRYAGHVPTPAPVYRPGNVFGALGMETFLEAMGLAFYGAGGAAPSTVFRLLQQEDADLGSESEKLIETASKAYQADEREALFTAEEQTKLEKIKSRREAITAELATLGEHREFQRRQLSAAGPDDGEGPITPLLAMPGDARPVAITDRLLADGDFANWRKKITPGTRGAIGTSPVVEFANLLPGRHRPGALVTSGAASGGAFYMPEQTGIVDGGTFQRELTILDVITRGSTDSDSVEFVRVTGFTNNAAAVAEADSVLTTDDTGRKPQSAMTFERVNQAVSTLAHWEAATSRSVADGGQLRTIIEGLLRYGLLEQLEDDVISGTGAPTFTGILQEANVQSQAFDTNMITTNRRAKTKVRTGGRARANAYLFHPNDWEQIDLDLTTAGGGSNYRQAAEVSQPRLWGLPVIESEAVPEGTGIVGDFTKAILWDRMQATIRVTDGYLDFVTKNLVLILAEMRAAFAVIRPEAFVSIDLAAGS